MRFKYIFTILFIHHNDVPHTKRDKVDVVNMTLVYRCQHRNGGKSRDRNMAPPINKVKELSILYKIII